ncbi:APC family permease [Ktedonosporobacter rubrisoli]|nr:APC family permease [Ktedonosporobacter rubrisoli]
MIDKPVDRPRKSRTRISVPLLSEEYAAKALPRIFGTQDMVAIMILAIFWISNSATAAGVGATAYVYWLIGGITFFIPCVIATAQLGSMFPQEGSLYNWTYQALGPYWSFFAGLCWWFPVPVILVSGADTMVAYIQGLNPSWLVEPWQQGLAVIIIIAITALIALQRIHIVRNLLNVGAGFILLATLLLAIAGIKWLLSGHALATSFTHLSDWSINQTNVGQFSLVVLAYLGSCVPLNMGGEIAGEGHMKLRIITRHLLWGTLLIFVGYVIATFALLAIEGPSNVGTVFALIAAVDTSLGKLYGNITAICIMGFFVIALIMYNVSFARLLFVGAIDQRIPSSVGRLNRQRVPANAILFQTGLALVFAAILFLVGPYIFSFDKAINLAGDFYNVALALVSIVWALCTIFFYVSLLRLYFSDRQKFRQSLLFPMPIIWLICLIGPLGCVATIVDALFFSWTVTIANSLWTIIVGSLLAFCFLLVAIGSMLATSEAAWQKLSR